MDVEVQQRYFFTCFRRRNHILVKCLTYLALETSPYIRVDKGRTLLMLFALKPFSYALEMDPLDTSDAAAWRNDWVAWFFFAQAYTATSFFCLFWQSMDLDCIKLITELTFLQFQVSMISVKPKSVEPCLFVLVANFDITHHCLVHHIGLGVCLDTPLTL